ncbi:glycerophosphodiester phosphodiesterase [Paenibacillus silvisoli]|uniref:glycerophosphodiester phosphodiesterase n=1 Tax=Paenibacillus silvisoli TaxID=3110539 RepID=UPI0028058AAD|nr:glycerophosphodiester phosphodiesterase [Paenibacillus silvisoli]
MRNALAAAHTGCGDYPDNTIASFKEALASGAQIAEVDVHAAADGTAVLLHDDSPLLRTHSYEQLNQADVRIRLDASYEQHELATLEQILQLSAHEGISLNLDLKSAEAIEPTVRLIRRYGAENSAYITGCSDGMTERYPDIQVMLNTPVELTEGERASYESYAEFVCRAAKDAGYAGLNMKASTCLQPIVERAHAVGLLVWVYTVDDPEQMKQYAGMGVDAITTRNPKDLLNLLK